MKTLDILDVDSLDVGVELLLGALLVVTLAGDADTETVGDALDTGFPDLLVELGVDTDVGGALFNENSVRWLFLFFPPFEYGGKGGTNHSTGGESADLLDSTRSTLLEGNTVHLYPKKERILVFRPNAI